MGVIIGMIGMMVAGTTVAMTGPAILAGVAVSVGVSAATAAVFGKAATGIVIAVALS